MDLDLAAEDMYFTTNTHPTDWWGEGDRRIGWDDARYRAVARRFAKVMWWNDAKELVVLKNPGEQRDTQEWEDARVAWNHPGAGAIAQFKRVITARMNTLPYKNTV